MLFQLIKPIYSGFKNKTNPYDQEKKMFFNTKMSQWQNFKNWPANC